MSLDDLSKTLCIISKSIGRDWNRLYCQLPFQPKRGQEALSDDLKHINGKYHRGDVFQVNNNFVFIYYLIFLVGSSNGCIK